MSEKPNLRLSKLHGRLGDLICQFTRMQFARGAETWAPSVNAYRCEKGFTICVDLAGVQKDRIEIQAGSKKVVVRGRREAPEPRGKGEEPCQIIAMEIDSGMFAREITLPVEVEGDAVRAEYKEGLLWVYLPFRCHS